MKRMEPLWISLIMANPFYFAAPVIQIPVSNASGASPVNIWGDLPAFPDLTFCVINPNPFDVRLRATPMNSDGTMPDPLAVTATSGTLVMARTMMGSFTSSKPVYVSAQAFATSGQPLPESGDYTDCWVEIYYGTGE